MLTIIIIIITISILIISIIFNILFFKKTKVLTEKINNFNNVIKRKGYYKSNWFQGSDKIPITAIVYVEEVDRYTNGTSLLRLKEIETYSSNSGYSKSNLLNHIEDTFIKIKKTNEIEWLESVDEISKIRNKKLERILQEK